MEFPNGSAAMMTIALKAAQGWLRLIRDLKLGEELPPLKPSLNETLDLVGAALAGGAEISGTAALLAMLDSCGEVAEWIEGCGHKAAADRLRLMAGPDNPAYELMNELRDLRRRVWRREMPFRTESGSVYECDGMRTRRTQNGGRPHEWSKFTVLVDAASARRVLVALGAGYKASFGANGDLVLQHKRLEVMRFPGQVPAPGIHPVEIFTDGSFHVGTAIVEAS